MAALLLKPYAKAAKEIVAEGCALQIQDFMVNAYGRGGDDEVYKQQKVWEAVPRGYSCVREQPDGPDHWIVGLRKFDYDATSHHCPAPEQVILLTKENGECAHVAAFVSVKGVPFWIVGSKHVHVVFSEASFSELEKHFSEPRFAIAKDIARIWHGMLPTIQAVALHVYLSETRFTFSGEAIMEGHEHIVHYDQKNVIRFFAITTDQPSVTGLTAVMPMEATQLFDRFQVPAAHFSPLYAYKSAAYDAALAEVRQQKNSEGVVAYGWRQDETHVSSIWKEKALLYIIERRARGIIVAGRVGWQAALAQCLKEYTADPEMVAWWADRLPILLKFGQWLWRQHILPAQQQMNVQNHWLTWQHTFAQRQVTEDVEDDSAATQYIMLVGVPCTGKSTLARALLWHLQQTVGKTACWLNQDEVGGERRFYLAALEKARVSGVQYIILDKSNLTAGNQADYKNCQPLQTFQWVHPDGKAALKALCVDRFQQRGGAHRSLRYESVKDMVKIDEVLDIMLGNERPAEAHFTILDVRHTPLEIFTQVCVHLRLPIDHLDAALSFSQQYEQALVREPRRPVYLAIVFSNMDVLLAQVPPASLKDKTVRSNFHVTLAYFGDGMLDPIHYLQQLSAVGQPIAVQVTDLVWDTKAVAAKVSLLTDLPGLSPPDHPHMTLALGKKIGPVYSKELLQKSEAETIRLTAIQFTGTIQMWYQ